MAKAASNSKTANALNLELSYQVPAQNGGFIIADPLKFCLRFRPPTIAIVYQVEHKQKGTRKYVHEIRVDLKESSDLGQVCEDLFVREKTYFNPNKISRQQVSPQQILNKDEYFLLL